MQSWWLEVEKSKWGRLGVFCWPVRRERLKIRVELCFALFSPPPLLFETVTRLYVLLQQTQHTYTTPLLLPIYLFHSPSFRRSRAAVWLSMGQCLRARWGGDLAAGAEGVGGRAQEGQASLAFLSPLSQTLQLGSGAWPALSDGVCVGRWCLSRRHTGAKF